MKKNNRNIFKASLLALAVSTALIGCDSDSTSTNTDTTEQEEVVANLATESRSIDSAKDNTWYTESQTVITGNAAEFAKIAKEKGLAKNVILFIGDGMGVSTVTAARILEGQEKGNNGEENNLSFDSFPFAGLAKTYNVNAQTPDSAGTMTAIMSGVKTDVGVIGVDEDIVRADCSTVSGNELVTALELAEISDGDF